MIKVQPGTYAPVTIAKSGITVRAAAANSRPVVDGTGVPDAVVVSGSGVTVRELAPAPRRSVADWLRGAACAGIARYLPPVGPELNPGEANSAAKAFALGPDATDDWTKPLAWSDHALAK